MKSISRKDKRVLVRLIYQINELVNFLFINLLFLKKTILVSDDQNLNPSGSKKYGNINQTVWLLNISRAFSLCNIISENKFNKIVSNAHWIDVGCGSGLASIYVSLVYGLKNQTLFDYDKKCVQESIANYKSYKKSLLYNLRHFKSKLNIYLADASNHILPIHASETTIIYMYNPFQEKVVREFISNNKFLIKKNVFLIYVNDIYRNSIKDELSDLKYKYRRNDFFQISVFNF